MEKSLGLPRALRHGENYGAIFETIQGSLPSGFERTLKMNGLNADEREHAFARQQPRGARTGRELNVFFQNAAQIRFFLGVDFGQRDKFAMENLVGLGTDDISETAGHARTEIEAQRTEDQYDASGHILAAMLANAFDDGESAAVAHGKAFAGAAGDIKLAGSRAVENGISCENIAAARGRGAGCDGNRAAGKSFANVVVGFAVELQGDPFGEEGAEALSCGARKFLSDLFYGGAAIFSAAHQFAAETGADAAVGIVDRLRLGRGRKSTAEVNRVFQGPGVGYLPFLRGDTHRLRNGHNEERIHAGTRAEPVIPAG